MASPKVWFITGCSSGFGREVALAARRRGDSVIATARKPETLDELKQLGCETLALDIASSETVVQQVVKEALALFGHIDIVVNNAGYAAFGAVEEANDKDLTDMFNTNLFGHLRVTRAVLPSMRERRSGVIAFIGSGAGYSALPMNGVYGAAKAALAGVSQSLAQEVAPLGIEVTIAELGVFRTNIMPSARAFERTFDEYAAGKKALLELAEAGVGAPPSDPAKGAQALVEALTKTGRCVGRALPRRMPLGGGMLEYFEAELAARAKELDDWKDFTDVESLAFDA